MNKMLTMHGVFLDVFGMGILLTGKSGVGKSEIALSLIDRGHRLVADDSVEFTRLDEQTIIGRCPDLLRDFLEVRGLGVLNIRAMFGDISVKTRKILHLVVNLLAISDEQFQTTDRLHGMHRNRKILQVNVPEVSIPVAPGRNLAILVESAARNQLQRAKGAIASDEFIARQRQTMHDGQI